MHSTEEHLLGEVVNFLWIGQLPNLSTNLLTQLSWNHNLHHLLGRKLTAAILIVMLKHFSEHYFLLLSNYPILICYWICWLLLTLEWLLLGVVGVLACGWCHYLLRRRMVSPWNFKILQIRQVCSKVDLRIFLDSWFFKNRQKYFNILGQACFIDLNFVLGVSYEAQSDIEFVTGEEFVWS